MYPKMKEYIIPLRREVSPQEKLDNTRRILCELTACASLCSCCWFSVSAKEEGLEEELPHILKLISDEGVNYKSRVIPPLRHSEDRSGMLMKIRRSFHTYAIGCGAVRCEECVAHAPLNVIQEEIVGGTVS